jgi:preprotein translocase subunit SecD
VRNTFPTFLTFLTFISCSAEKPEPAADWSRVPVSIELRLAEGSPGTGLEARTVYGQGKKIYLHQNTELSNRDIARVEATQTRIGKGLILDVWYTKTGAARMDRLTTQHVGDSLAILINSVPVAVPIIQQKLNPGTQAPISIGVPLEPKEAARLGQAVSKTWPQRR